MLFFNRTPQAWVSGKNPDSGEMPHGINHESTRMIWRQNQIGTVAKQSECGRPGRGNARRWQPVGNHGPIREDIEVVTSAALSGFGIFDGRFTQGGASLALGYPLSGFQPF
jgi:hypothetical protein